MKNAINIILKPFKLFGDFVLNIILFLFYIIFFFPYKIFYKEKNKGGWQKSGEVNLENKNLPF